MVVASAITLEWERDSPCGTTRYTACCSGGGVSRRLVVRQCARIYHPRMVQNRTGFEVAKEEEAEKMTASEWMRERWSGKRSRRAAVKERLLDTVGETKDGNREPT